MLIVQIRGTSGAGKTTAMRKIIAELAKTTPRPLEIRAEGKKRPVSYGYGSIAVVGAYTEATCGGCDTISGYKLLFDVVNQRIKEGYKSILMEGLLLSEDVKNTLTLPVESLRIIFLTTPIETCLDRVGQRRKAKGNEEPLNPTNTRNRVETILRARRRLEDAGVKCISASGDQAPGIVLRWLKGG